MHGFQALKKWGSPDTRFSMAWNFTIVIDWQMLWGPLWSECQGPKPTVYHPKKSREERRKNSLIITIVGCECSEGVIVNAESTGEKRVFTPVKTLLLLSLSLSPSQPRILIVVCKIKISIWCQSHFIANIFWNSHSKTDRNGNKAAEETGYNKDYLFFK